MMRKFKIKGIERKDMIRKLDNAARQTGVATVYSILLLWYSFANRDTPIWAKNIILGILGYFLAPIDSIPDFTPLLGYTDDIGVIGFGLVSLACYIKDDIRENARVKLNSWFKEYDPALVDAVDRKL